MNYFLLKINSFEDITMASGLVFRKMKFKSSVEGLFLTKSKQTSIEFCFIYEMCITHKLQSNHRITEWFGLEGTLKIIQFQTPCLGQGHLSLNQIAQSLIRTKRDVLNQYAIDNSKQVGHRNNVTEHIFCHSNSSNIILFLPLYSKLFQKAANSILVIFTHYSNMDIHL